MQTKTKFALAGAAATMAMGAGASAASAYSVVDYPTSTVIANGTSWNATAGTVALKNSSGTTVTSCTSSSLSGVVAGNPSAGALNVTGGAFSGCTLGGAAITVTPIASATSPWVLTATSGTGPSYAGNVSNVVVNIQNCRYSGALASGVTINNLSPKSNISLVQSGALTKQGQYPGAPGACSALLPATGYIQTTYTVGTVGAPYSNLGVQ